MYKRKNYIVNKEIQYGMIATFLFVVLLSLILFSIGFTAYYLITNLVGENIYEEFIEITRQVVIKIRPINEEDLKDPLGLALKLQKAEDPLSAYLKQNSSWTSLELLDLESPLLDSFEIQKILVSGLNNFLQNLIRRGEKFYKAELFKDVKLETSLLEKATKLENFQSAEAYEFNLKLLQAAYQNEISLSPNITEKDLISFSFQRSDPGLKRYELVLPPLIINNLILMILIVVIGIFYSHRIAGPLLRIERDILRAIEGEKGIVIRLREKDKLKPLAAVINKLINELDKTRQKK